MWDESKHPRNKKGQFAEKNGDALKIELDDKPKYTVVDASINHPRIFTDARSVDDFFWYDDDKRGLLARRNSKHGLWDKALTASQRFNLNDYTGDGYSNINSYLRGYDNGSKYSIDYIKTQIKSIDKAIASYELAAPIITYRSINSDAFCEYLDNIEASIGTEYSDKAFMSTSPTLDSPALNKDLLMTIKLPSGKGIGAYIDGYNGLGEKEFLLARGSKFRITNAYRKNKNYFVEMELIK